MSFSKADLVVYLIIYISGIDLYMYKCIWESYTIFMDEKKKNRLFRKKIVTG